jgi:hypothetical protein
VRGDARVTDNILVGSSQFSVLPLTGAGQPDVSAAVGQVYVDTVANDAWIFVGSGTWKKITCCEVTCQVERPEVTQKRDAAHAAPNPMRGSTRHSLSSLLVVPCPRFCRALPSRFRGTLKDIRFHK